MRRFNAKLAKEAICDWIAEWFEANGPGCNAVIGISGGKDSTIVAALCAEALGKDRVIGVLMPNGEQADIEDAYAVVNHLGIKHFTINIQTPVRTILTGLAAAGIKPSEQTKINLPARIRMSTLYAVSQSNNGRVINTCNLSENWIGYSTTHGDAAGDMSPLANFTVTEIKMIGDELGLPKNLVHKAPSDGLCGQTDEDKIGFTYSVLDDCIRRSQVDDETAERIRKMHEKNAFKMRPMSEFHPKDYGIHLPVCLCAWGKSR